MNPKSQVVFGIFTLLICIGVYFFRFPAPVPDVVPDPLEIKAAKAAAAKPATPPKPPVPPVAPAAPTIVSTAADGTVTTSTGLQYKIVQAGTGAVATAGQKVSVNYAGTLTDGTKFDASADHGGPFSFQLGTGEVIKGWDEGVAGMKVGEKRKLIIPANLGYGPTGAGGGKIPPNATLLFDVELVDVK